MRKTSGYNPGMTTRTGSSLESFNLDHTRVRAPYVRTAGKYTTAGGDVISKFDLRFVQPNRSEIPTGPLHTIEHLLAGFLRDELGDVVIDASPMGCRTGFYMVCLGEPEPAAVAEALESALRRVAAFEGAIPGCSELECGNWRDHSLPGARAWAEQVLSSDIIVQETVTIGS